MQHRLQFRFSLKTLLILFAAFSLCLWFGLYLRRAHNYHAAVQAIQAYGAWVRYDFQFPGGTCDFEDFDPQARSGVPRWLLDRFGVDSFHDIVQVNLSWSEDSGTLDTNTNRSDRALQHLPSLPNLRALYLSGTQASDAGMYYIGKLGKLEYLMMMDASTVSDAGVEHLRHLSTLKMVMLSNSRISDRSLVVFGRMHTLERIYLQGEDYHFTDVGLAALANLTELRVLVLNHGSTNFTDTGLIHLRTLTNLEHLEVQGPGITDEGIQHLSTLQNLRTVWITGSKVTPAGLRAVQARLPTTRFEVHPLSH